MPNESKKERFNLRTFLRRRRFLLTIVLSLVLVWSIPLLTLISGNYSSIAAVESSTEETYESILGQFAYSIDSKLGYVRSVMLQISNEPKIKKLLRNHILTAEDHYDINEMIRSNASHILSDSLISEIYVYVNRSNTIFTTSSVYNGALFDMTMGTYNGVSPSEWFADLCSGKQLYDDIRRVHIENNGAARDAIVCVQSLPFVYGSSVNGLIAIELDVPAIKAAAEKMNNLFNVYLFGPDDTCLFSINTNDDLLEAAKSRVEKARDSVKVDKEEYNRVVIHKNTYNIDYVALSPMPEYLGQVLRLQRSFYLQLLICVVASVTLIVVITRQYNMIISEIMRQAGQVATSRGRSTLSEMEYISNSFDVALKRQQKLQQALNFTEAAKKEADRILTKNQSAMFNNLIAALVMGKTEQYSDLDSIMAHFGIALNGECYLGLRILIYPLNPNDHVDSEVLVDALSYVTKTLEGKLSLKRVICLSSNLENNISAILVNYSEGQLEQVMDEIQEICATITGQLREDFGLCMTIGMSNEMRQLEDMDIACQQAEAALDHGLMLSCKEVFRYSNIYSKDKEYYYPIEIEQNFTEILLSGDLKKARELLDMIYEENLCLRSLTPQMIYYAFMNIACTLTKTLGILSAREGYTDSDSQEILARLSSCHRVEEFQFEIDHLAESICTLVNRSQDVDQKKLRKKLLAYIDENYTDSAMSQQDVASAMNISASYLSKYFKQEFHENMLTYVNKKRVNRAKSLLSDTDLVLDEIAVQTGFASAKALIRVFKQYEGVTPGTYRGLAACMQEEDANNQ